MQRVLMAVVAGLFATMAYAAPSACEQEALEVKQASAEAAKVDYDLALAECPKSARAGKLCRDAARDERRITIKQINAEYQAALQACQAPK